MADMTDMLPATSQELTLVAAIIAAAVSLVNLALMLHARRAAEFRAAHREAISPFLSKLGDSVHQTVALSKLTLMANTPETYRRRYDEACRAAKDLKQIRREARYGLWGVEEQINVLARLPDWLAHERSYPEAASGLFDAGAALAQALDQAIVRSYVAGRPPTLVGRTLVHWRASRFRKKHTLFMNTPREQRR